MTQTPKVRVFPSQELASCELAADIAALIRKRSALGQTCVLGLATGSTPILFYQELVRLHREEGLSFKHVTTFNLDEYHGLSRDHPQSYWSFMHHQLFDHVDIPAENIHLPDGLAADPTAHAAEYEEAIRQAGGIDFQILGIGRNGHIGFNEPGSPATSRTREITLNPTTREDAAPAFGGLDSVPTLAISMGCATILEARKIALLAFGTGKASIVRQALSGPVTEDVTASFLQRHPDTVFLLDQPAATEI